MCRGSVAWFLAVCILLTLVGCSDQGADKVQTADPIAVLATPTATLVPTSEPTPTVTSVPTPEPTSTPVTDAVLASGVFDKYFNDALFIGDSITRDLHRYVLDKKQDMSDFMGTSVFLYSSGYHLMPAISDDPSFGVLIYRGESISVTDAINVIEAKKVFILLGAGDLRRMNLELVTDRYRTLLGMIRENCPMVEMLVVQAITPITPLYCKKNKLILSVWNACNGELEQMCKEDEVVFLDVATPLKNEKGLLRDELTYDGRHLNEAGNEIWVRELRKFAMQQTGTGGAAYIPVWPTPEPALEPAGTHEP